MPRGSQLNDFEIGQIKRLKEAGYTQRGIAREIRRSQTAVGNVLQAGAKYNTKNYLRGRRSALSEGDKREVFKLAATGQFTVREIQRQLPTSVSHATVYKVLKQDTKPRATPNYHCLFCLKPCWKATPLMDLVEIHGAVRCVKLQKQLQQLFILRQLLDIPSSWCEEMLQRDDGDSNPESWFRICQACTNTVKEAWNTYQKLQAILEKMGGLKEHIKEVMMASICKTNRNTGGVDNEIRTILFPEEMASLNNRDQKDSIELNASSDLNPDSDSPINQDQDDSMNLSDVDEDGGDNIKMLSTSSTSISSTMSNSHTKGEFLCHLCGCEYAYQSVLDTHYRNFHPQTNSEGDGGGDPSASKQENFKCKYCELSSPFRVNIVRHMQTHKEEVGHQCDICLKYYMNIQMLRRHKRMNHPSTVEESKCPYCFKSFNSLDDVKNHTAKYCKVKLLDEKAQTQSSTAGENVAMMMMVDHVSVKQDEIIHPPEAVSMSNMSMPLNNAEVTQEFKVSTSNIMYEENRWNY